MFRKIVNIVCEWSHSYDESEWSLITSLIRRFWVPYEQSAGRSLRETCGSQSPLFGPSGCSSQQRRDEAMIRDGNFDQSVSKPNVFRWMENAPCLFTFQNRSETGGW